MTNYSKDRFLRLINEHRSVKNKQPLKEQNIVDDAIDDPMNIEFEDTMECPECGGTAQLIGRLGNRKHYKCESCGLDVSQELDENRWAMSEETMSEDDVTPGYGGLPESEELDGADKLDECGCEEEVEPISHSHECPLCGSELMNGECEHHGHMMHEPIEIETVYEVRKMQRMAGILKEDVSDSEGSEPEEPNEPEEVNEASVAANLPTTPSGLGEGDKMDECDMSASNEIGGFDDLE